MDRSKLAQILRLVGVTVTLAATLGVIAIILGLSAMLGG